MPRLRPLLGLVCTVLFLSSSSHADVYASGITFTNPDDSAFDGNPADGTPLKIAYVLNDTASQVTIRIHLLATDAVLHTIIMNGLSSGRHSTTWDGTGSEGAGTFYVTVEATQTPRSSTNYSLFKFIPTSVTGHNIFSRGVDVVRDPQNAAYGYYYTANAGGPLLKGLCLYSADGGFAGTNDGSPILTPALSTTDGGAIPWSNDVSAPVKATTDYRGRVYVSDYPKGEVWRMDDPMTPPKKIIGGLTSPAGLAAVGVDADFKLYIAAGNDVVRADLGLDDTLEVSLVTVAALGRYVHDIAIDDAGFLYVNVRSGTGWAVTAGGTTEQYDITGTLPVQTANALWSFAWTGFPIGLGHWSGATYPSADDDIIYVSHRRASTADAPGVYMITKLHDAFDVTRTHLIQPDDIPESAGGDVNATSDVTVDPVGNVVYFENGNEEIIMLSPPSSAFTVSHTTRSSGNIEVGTASSVDGADVPQGFRLHQNYPNPFNPATQISFTLESAGFTTLRVFDILGREVATLVDESMPSGSFQVAFEGRNLPSGTYIYVLQHDGMTVSRRMALLR